MRYIKTYESFRQEELVNEEILGWIKKKAKALVDKFKSLTGKSFATALKYILPDELVDAINKETNKYFVKESLDNLLLEELFDFKSDDEIEKMTDEEYDEYLKGLADKNIFSTDIENMDNSKNKEFMNYLQSRGIEVEQEVVVKTKPSTDYLYNKIDKMEISDTSKKVLKYGTMCLFFFMMFTKMGGGAVMAAEAGHDHAHDLKDVKGDGDKDVKKGEEKGSKSNGESTKTPFSDVKSDSDNYRSVGVGESDDLGMAKEIAMSDATGKIVKDSGGSTTTTLKSINDIGTKVFKNNQTGKYKVYQAIEVEKSNVKSDKDHNTKDIKTDGEKGDVKSYESGKDMSKRIKEIERSGVKKTSEGSFDITKTKIESMLKLGKPISELTWKSNNINASEQAVKQLAYDKYGVSNGRIVVTNDDVVHYFFISK